MKIQRLRILLPVLFFAAFSGCDKLALKKTPPLTVSKDFWLDRCDMKYRGMDFPFTGAIEDMVRLLGPFDRLDTLSGRHFWDRLGLQVAAYRGIGRIRSIDLYFAREESESESALRALNRPEDSLELNDIRSTYPHGFFKGELVLEGAMIGPEIDFRRVNDTRSLYLETQSGPDAHSIAIQQSWSGTRYAYERNCADGKHIRIIFTLLSSVPPFRMESLSLGSDNVPDSLYMQDAEKRNPP